MRLCDLRDQLTPPTAQPTAQHVNGKDPPLRPKPYTGKFLMSGAAAYSMIRASIRASSPWVHTSFGFASTASLASVSKA